VFNFDKPWAAEIAEVTGRREYQSVDILIQDTSGVKVRTDFATGKKIYEGEPVLIYEGQARVIGVRAGSVIEGADMANATTIKAIRFQTPYQSIGNISNGQTVRVTRAPQNPALERYVYKVNSDIQGGSAATRTFEAGVDLESKWPTP